MKLELRVDTGYALMFWIIVMMAKIEGADCHRMSRRHVNSTESIVAEVETKVTLVCNSDGAPTLNISWFKNHESLSGSSRIEIRESGFVLEINGVKPEDAGLYICDADDGFNITVYPLGELVVIDKAEPKSWLVVGVFLTSGLLTLAVFALLRLMRLRQSHYPFSYRHLCALDLCKCFRKKHRMYNMTTI